MKEQENATMQEQLLEKRIKKSDLWAKDVFAYEYLMKKSAGLLRCRLRKKMKKL